MVNLRYHIVSLTAVFLALGLGILAGTTVIDDQVVKGLRANTAALRNDLDTLRGNVSELQAQLNVWDEFGKSIAPSLLQGQLAGRAVVILADEKVPGALSGQINDAFRLANAKRPTRLTLKQKFVDPASFASLAEAVGTSGSSSPEALMEEAGRRVGSRLGGSSDPRASDDLLRKLADGGFLDIADLPALGPFPAANALVVFVTSGAAPEESLLSRSFFIPALRALTSARVACSAEPTTAKDHVAELVRRDGAISRSVCTVDHVDTVPGRLSLVYALRSLMNGRPAEHYGIRGGIPVAPNLRPA